MREMNREKTMTERMRMGETGMSVYMDGSIESDGEGGLHIEIEIGIEQSVLSVSDADKHFVLIKKSMDVLAGMEHGEEMWEDAKSHARWILETMASGIARQSAWNDSAYWFQDDSVSAKWDERLHDSVVTTPLGEIERPCHICDGDCEESGCLIGVRERDKGTRMHAQITSDIREVLGL